MILDYVFYSKDDNKDGISIIIIISAVIIIIVVVIFITKTYLIQKQLFWLQPVKKVCTQKVTAYKYKKNQNHRFTFFVQVFR